MTDHDIDRIALEQEARFGQLCDAEDLRMFARACVAFDRAPTIGEQPTADQQAAGSVEVERDCLKYLAQYAMERHGQVHHYYRVDDVRAALDSRAQPVAQPAAAGELPKLPKPVYLGGDEAFGDQVYGYTADQMHRYAHEHADNTPWLRLAHIICADAGIPPGRIDDRLEALRDMRTGRALRDKISPP